jgi:uncharacterized membrane protein
VSDSAPENQGEQELILSAERAIAKRLEQSLPRDRQLEPQELAKVLAQIVSVEIRQVAYSFQGPMPPPEMLKSYEATLPGLADRIAKRAESEQAFRHEIGRSESAAVVRSQWMDFSKTAIGQAFGFAIATLAIGGGIYLSANGKETAGLVSIILGLVSLVAVFATGKVAETLIKKAETANETKPPAI